MRLALPRRRGRARAARRDGDRFGSCGRRGGGEDAGGAADRRARAAQVTPPRFALQAGSATWSIVSPLLSVGNYARRRVPGLPAQAGRGGRPRWACANQGGSVGWGLRADAEALRRYALPSAAGPDERTGDGFDQQEHATHETHDDKRKGNLDRETDEKDQFEPRHTGAAGTAEKRLGSGMPQKADDRNQAKGHSERVEEPCQGATLVAPAARGSASARQSAKGGRQVAEIGVEARHRHRRIGHDRLVRKRVRGRPPRSRTGRAGPTRGGVCASRHRGS